MDTSLESLKKQPLEDLSKEEILIKYRGVLQILQKAKQSKATLIEENTSLKTKLESQSKSSAVEVVNTLTQQKLELVTNLEEVNRQKDLIENKLKICEFNLNKAESKTAELDIQNQSYERQIKRLSDDNEQLLHQLDTLEKQTNEFKEIGLQQQQQLLELERNGISNELMEKNKIIESLMAEQEETKNQILHLTTTNHELIEQYNDLLKNVEILEANYKNSEIHVNSLKKQNENYVNAADDLNIELHKNKALVEKLQQDVTNMTARLSDNQIVSSGVASDLENTNEKLRDKLKLFHSKIVKFAGDIRLLKKQKIDVLDHFRQYIQQVKLWETQLKEFSDIVFGQFKLFEEEKVQLKSQIGILQSENYNLQIQNQQLTG